WLGHAIHWDRIFLLAGGSRDLWLNWSSLSSVLVISIRFCGYLFHDYFRRHDRTHRFRRRFDLQRRRLRLHLSDHWSLGVGTGRFSRQHGQRWKLSTWVR